MTTSYFMQFCLLMCSFSHRQKKRNSWTVSPWHCFTNRIKLFSWSCCQKCVLHQKSQCHCSGTKPPSDSSKQADGLGYLATAGGHHFCRNPANQFLYQIMCIYLFFSLYGHIFLWHMEVPRLGVESELQLWPTPQPQQGQFRATSAAYITDHSNTRSLTHWAVPGIEPASS